MAKRGSDDVDPTLGVGRPDDGEHHAEGGELLLEEAREEARRLVSHPLDEVKRLERVADEGESAATPLILAVGVIAFLVVVLAIFLTVVFLVYYNA
jgi:hypothetical protein